MPSFIRISIGLTLLLVPTLAWAGKGDVAADPQTPAIWNGSETEPCAWPSVVRVTGGGSLCSATLIHPQVVMYAAHCGTQDKVVRFGDSDNTGKTELVEYCKSYPGYNSQGNDWAYCVLQDPVDEIPITPVGYGCEINQYVAHGADIAIVGFGNNSGDSGAGRKRWAFSKMWNPGFSTFNVGGQGYPSVCSGDSGGPAFIRYADGTWHTYGIASTKNSNTCDQAGGTHSLATRAVEWIETDSGIDVTVCHDLEGNWDPGPYCGRFFNGEPQLSYGSWYTWCEDVTASGWSSTCGTDYESLYSESELARHRDHLAGQRLDLRGGALGDRHRGRDRRRERVLGRADRDRRDAAAGHDLGSEPHGVRRGDLPRG
ncbi:MAG: trypsin-like serine protease [Deltaproteobacteria bacterium]|nr:trypsin-like serine protease [Deltaproteobacteria bacterium]